MSKRCNLQDCYIDDDEGCAIGHMDPKVCEHYSSVVAEVGEDPGETIDEVTVARVPWTGNAMGLIDIAKLVPRARTTVIGVMGTHDTGKTTLLLGNYLSCVAGSSIGDAEFSGSWTLGAWEALAAWPRFDGSTISPSFPPHTPRDSSRSPGLLHLALRRPDDSHRDVLLTDAPGEWFGSWANNKNAHDAAGARWTVEHSNAFLLFADCERLNGARKGSARRSLRQLIERLGPYVAGRPVVLVWTKADKCPRDDLPPLIRESIQKSLKDSIPHAEELVTTVTDTESLTNVLALVLEKSWYPSYAKAITEPVLDQQPFSAFRGFHEDS